MNEVCYLILPGIVLNLFTLLLLLRRNFVPKYQIKGESMTSLELGFINEKKSSYGIRYMGLGTLSILFIFNIL